MYGFIEHLFLETGFPVHVCLAAAVIFGLWVLVKEN